MFVGIVVVVFSTLYHTQRFNANSLHKMVCVAWRSIATEIVWRHKPWIKIGEYVTVA